jgi:hypothetical protein
MFLGTLEIDAELPVAVALVESGRVIDASLVTEATMGRTTFKCPDLGVGGQSRIIVDLEEPIPRLRAALASPSSEIHQEMFDATGRATFSNLTAGIYLLRLEAQQIGLFLGHIPVGAGETVKIGPLKTGLAHSVHIRLVQDSNKQPLRLPVGTNGVNKDHFLECVPLTEGLVVNATVDPSCFRSYGVMESGETGLSLYPGQYGVRLRGPTWNSEYHVVDVRDADVQFSFSCSESHDLVISPELDWKWRGSVLTIADERGFVLWEQILFAEGPAVVRLPNGWVRVLVSDGAGRVFSEAIVPEPPASGRLELRRR